jgi:hypothetical protein
MGLPLPHPTPYGWVMVDDYSQHRSELVWDYLMLIDAVRMAWMPYIVFVACVIWWGWDKPVKSIRKSSWLLPLAFFPFMLLFIDVIGLAGQPKSALGFYINAKLAFAFSLLVIPFGYFYVIVGNILVFAASKIRLIGKST